MLKDDKIQIFEERAEKLKGNKNKVFLKRKRKELFSNAEKNLLEVAVGIIKTCLLDTHYLIWAKPNLNS